MNKKDVNVMKKLDVKKIDKNMKSLNSNFKNLQWFSPKNIPFCISGFAWYEEEKLYRRMPKNPKWPLPVDVDKLANCTAGGQIRFRSNTKRLSIRVQLTGVPDLCHMAATGEGGFDCYIGDSGSQLYVATTKFDRNTSFYEVLLFEFKDYKLRNITLNFPLYQGVKEVELGVDKDARVFSPLPYKDRSRIIFYGTSITQGGCASRPGMAYTNILSRRFNYEFINLGFSGSGKGEPEVAKIISEIKYPGCFVLDYEANCISTKLFKKTLPEFIKILRSEHKDIPIIVVSRIKFAVENFNQRVEERVERKRIQEKLVKNLKAHGDSNIYFVDGSEFLGPNFDECTVDGVHPTDLGFLRIADGLTPILNKILTK